MRSPAIIAGFSSELTKLALSYRELAGIGAGTGAMLNMGGRAKSLVGADYSPEQKGRTLAGDTAKGALAAVAAGALLAAISRGSVKLPKR
ncbi:MAG: hypothetical protein DRP42_00580 [Tenericutes bacterium]|nr:MAG: hypothetical protein DRP42_00580 [Mycoplasmatota bacterium]